MASYKTTATAKVKKKPQMAEEVTAGTLHLGAVGNPTKFRHFGHVTELSDDLGIENEQFPVMGEYDIGSQIKLGETYNATLTFRPSPTTKAMLKYGVELPDTTTAPDPTATTPNGTNGITFSILFSQLVNGVEGYFLYLGTVIASTSYTISRDGGVTVTWNLRCKEIQENVSEPTWVAAAVYATAVTDDPMTGLSSGANPMSLGGTNYHTNSFTLNIDFGLAEYLANGELSYLFLEPLARRITFSFNTPYKGTTLYNAWKNYTALALVYTIATGIVLNGTSLKIDARAKSNSSGAIEFTLEECSGTVKSCTLAIS